MSRFTLSSTPFQADPSPSPLATAVGRGAPWASRRPIPYRTQPTPARIRTQQENAFISFADDGATTAKPQTPGGFGVPGQPYASEGPLTLSGVTCVDRSSAAKDLGITDSSPEVQKQYQEHQLGGIETQRSSAGACESSDAITARQAACEFLQSSGGHLDPPSVPFPANAAFTKRRPSLRTSMRVPMTKAGPTFRPHKRHLFEPPIATEQALHTRVDDVSAAEDQQLVSGKTAGDHVPAEFTQTNPATLQCANNGVDAVGGCETINEHALPFEHAFDHAQIPATDGPIPAADCNERDYPDTHGNQASIDPNEDDSQHRGRVTRTSINRKKRKAPLQEENHILELASPPHPGRTRNWVYEAIVEDAHSRKRAGQDSDGCLHFGYLVPTPAGGRQRWRPLQVENGRKARILSISQSEFERILSRRDKLRNPGSHSQRKIRSGPVKKPPSKLKAADFFASKEFKDTYGPTRASTQESLKFTGDSCEPVQQNVEDQPTVQVLADHRKRGRAKASQTKPNYRPLALVEIQNAETARARRRQRQV